MNKYYKKEIRITLTTGIFFIIEKNKEGHFKEVIYGTETRVGRPVAEAQIDREIGYYNR